jgi:Secretion system C-terminal sorting domain
MKKTSLLFLFCACMHLQTFATHIIGGSLSYLYKGNDVYDLSLTLYRDCLNGNVPFDSIAWVGVFDQDWNPIAVYDFIVPPTDTLNLQNTPLCYPPPLGSCVHRAVYHKDITLPYLYGGYKILYQTCCRTFSVLNIDIPGGVGISYECNLISENNSPILKNALPYYSFAQKPFIYDAGATDVDGDSLAYRLVRPKGGGEWLGSPSPSVIFEENYSFGFDLDHVLGISQYPLTMNVNTGEIQALPMIEGLFVVSFVIEEWRNGQKLGEYYNEVGVEILDGQSGLGVEGIVTLEDLTDEIDEADLHLIQRNPFTDSLWIEKSTTINSSSYLFTDTYTSKYYARALPTNNSIYFQNYWPTYYPDKIFWFDATEFEVCQQSALFIDIILQKDTIQLQGNGSIEGKLFSTDMSPVSDFELWLMDVEKRPVAWTNTDPNGSFKFENLPITDLYLYSNARNALIFNSEPPQIPLVANQQNVGNLEFEVTSSAIVPIVSSKSKNLVSFGNLEIAPSPANQTIFIKNIDKIQSYNYRILDMQGHILIEDIYDANISISNFKSGVYTLQILGKNQVLNGRFVKI